MRVLGLDPLYVRKEKYLKVIELPKVYQSYLYDEYCDDKHKLITVEMAIKQTQSNYHMKALKTMKKILKKRITVNN